jgi:hypothetical protein
VSTGNSLLELLGYGTPEITFLGRAFTIRPDGLIPLLRYARTTMGKPDQVLTDSEAENVAMAASHRLLDDCVEDFGAFAALALDGKADSGDITAAVAGLASYYCARSHWAGMRLIAYLAANLDEVDGQLIRAGGRGVASLSAREACNLALAILLDDRSEEDRTIFLDDLNYEGNPEAEALAMVRQMQAAKKAAAQG